MKETTGTNALLGSVTPFLAHAHYRYLRMTSRTSSIIASTPLVGDLPQLELEFEDDEHDAEYLEDEEYDEEVCMRTDGVDASVGIRRDLFGGLLGKDLHRLQTGLDNLEGRSRNICVLGHRLWSRYVDVCLLHKSRLFVMIWGTSTLDSVHEA
jgi:hypothetical protein